MTSPWWIVAGAARGVTLRVVTHAFCPDPYVPRRRRTHVCRIGDVPVGGDHPIVVQSMTTTDTLDVDGTVAQTLALAEAGSEIVRITAPTVKAARALAEIRDKVRAAGCNAPLVADIHFTPAAAMEAVKHVEKVRVNPGNYVDSKRFRRRDYTDEEYGAEIRRVQERFRPLVQEAKRRGVALRIGTNHGSLSDRVMNQFGDTPLGMVESALEYLAVCEEEEHRDVVLSMKSSNPQAMVQAYRMLSARLDVLGWPYPFHLGVTEAGEGEDGRTKSAIGIASLLRDGIGDTIRVSLTEHPVREVPVAQSLLRLVGPLPLDEEGPFAPPATPLPFDPFEYAQRASESRPFGAHKLGGDGPVVVMVALRAGFPAQADCIDRLRVLATPAGPGIPALEGVLLEDADSAHADRLRGSLPGVAVCLRSELAVRESVTGYRRLAVESGRDPLVLVLDLPANRDDALLEAAGIAGPLLADGVGDALCLGGAHEPEDLLHLTLGVLQSSRLRSSRTEYIACPGCGRTLFDLEETTQRIKARTGHLPGVKIAVMGCIVNGPGEMADADFGYVGSAPGLVNLYVGKEIVRRGVAQSDADDELIDLLREHGVWREPQPQAAG